MKPKILIAVAGLALAATLFPIRDAAAQTAAPKPAGVNFPFGKQCVVTMDHKWSAAAAANSPGKDGGFHPDWTVRGTLTFLNSEWIVLTEGNYETWLPRPMVMAIRVSK